MIAKKKTTEEWFQGLVDKYKDDLDYIAEGVLIDVTEQIIVQLESKKLTRTQLAQKLNCSNAYVTKLLNGSENLTLKKLVHIAQVLDCNIDFAFVPKQCDVRRHIIFKSKRLDKTGYTKPIKCENDNEQHLSPLAA